MSGPERLEGAIPAESVASKSEALTSALQSLYSAYQKTFVYPPDPPSVPGALSRAVRGLEQVLDGRNEIVFDVTGRQLLVDGEPCAEMGAAAQSLAALLHDLNLEALEFSTGLTVRELESFIDGLGRAKREGCKGSGFVDMLKRADVERVRARVFADGACRVDQPARRPRDERTATFVEGLGPRLRRDLLRVDLQLSPDSRDLPEPPGAEWPGSELLDALRELDSIGARLPGQLLTLLNKLVRTSRKHYTLASGLRDRLASWNVAPEILSGQSGSLRAALVEIFQRRSHANFIPLPHRNLLDRLSRSRLEPTAFDLMNRFRDPRNMQDVRLQAAQVAVRLVGGRGGERHRAGIFAFLALAADFLIERGQFDVVHDAAVSARTYCLLKTEPESTRRAARGFLEEFRSEKRIRMILEHACKADGFSPDALNLLSLGGETRPGLRRGFPRPATTGPGGADPRPVRGQPQHRATRRAAPGPSAPRLGRAAARAADHRLSPAPAGSPPAGDLARSRGVPRAATGVRRTHRDRAVGRIQDRVPAARPGRREPARGGAGRPPPVDAWKRRTRWSCSAPTSSAASKT